MNIFGPPRGNENSYHRYLMIVLPKYFSHEVLYVIGDHVEFEVQAIRVLEEEERLVCSIAGDPMKFPNQIDMAAMVAKACARFTKGEEDLPPELYFLLDYVEN